MEHGLIADYDESMDLRKLRYFDAVVRQGGFTRAAEHLHVAQPAISAQIRQLEAELGVQLLQRTTRRVELTHAGELVLAHARSILGQVGELRDSLAGLASVLRGTVRIGATEVLGTLDLPAAMAAFHARWPGVGLSLRSGLVTTLLAQLRDRELDFVVAPIHGDLPRRYVALPLVEERIVLIARIGHPLEGARKVTLAAVRNEAFVCLPQGSGLRAILSAAAAREGFRPAVEFEAPSPARIRDFVAAGLGVGLLARSAALAPGAPVGVHELKHPPPHPPIGLVAPRKPALAAPAQACWDHLSGFAAGMSKR